LVRRVLYLLRVMADRGVVRPSLDGPAKSKLATLEWALGVFLAMGCGGGAPLLHPAHALPLDTVSFGAGVTTAFASGAVKSRISRGRAAAGEPLANGSTARTYADGALLQALLGPETSPWVSGRVGLPASSEAGLTYTGRAIRLDGRHVLSLGQEWALSVGLGVTALLLASDSPPPDPAASGANNPGAAFDLDATGWGGDVPVLIGYQALGGLLEMWGGARLGFERIDGELRTSSTALGDAGTNDVDGTRLWAGALAGFSLGVPPVWLRFELATALHRLNGQVHNSDAEPALAFGRLEQTAWTLSPSGAIVGKF
jgi:hypothetical protein